MIGIIGYQDEIIGFGLAGITQKIELTRAATKENVKEALNTLAQETEAVFISESLHQLVRGARDLPDIILIDIPEDKNTTNLDEVEALIKETLGITLK